MEPELLPGVPGGVGVSGTTLELGGMNPSCDRNVKSVPDAWG
jgi:hypothetical protein